MSRPAFRSLSRAMFLGFVRDRTALFFTLLFPVLFLLLFGSLYKTSSAPRVSVLEVGRVSLLDQAASAAPAQLGKVLAITHTADLQTALADVRKGDYDAAVQQSGRTLVVHYSIADQTTAGVVQAVFTSIVQQADAAAAGSKGAYQLTTPRVGCGQAVSPSFVKQADAAAAGSKGAYQLTTAQVEDKSLKPIQYLAPGLLGWAIASGGTFGAAITLVNWRENKLLRRLRLAPVSVGTVVLARVGVTVAVALAELVVFMAIATTPYFGFRLPLLLWVA